MRSYSSIIISVAAAFFVCGFSHAQTIVIDTSDYRSADDFHIENYDSRQFMDQNSVKFAFLDQNQLLWMATEKGVGSFDGSSFIGYNNEDFSSSDRNVDGFYPCGDTIFVGGSMQYVLVDGELVTLDEPFALKGFHARFGGLLTPENYKGFDGLLNYSEELKDLYESDDHHLFFLRESNEGVYVYLKDGYHYFENGKHIGRLPADPDSPSWMDITIVDEHLLWFGPRRQKVEVFKRGRSLGVYELNGFEDRVQTVALHDERGSFLKHKDEIYSIRFVDGTLRFELKIKGFAPACINSLVQLDGGGFYMGTCSQGLYSLRPKSFWSSPGDLQDRIIYAHEEVGKDSIITPAGILQYPGGLELMDWTEYTFQERYMLLDSKKRLWLSSDTEGYIREKGVFEKLPFEAPRFEEGENGLIWAAGEDTLWELKEDTWDTIPFKWNGESPRDLIYDHYREALWIILGREVLTYDPATKEVLYFDSIKGLEVTNIYPDSSGITWFNTYSKGLYAHYKGEFKKLEIDRNAFLSNSHCILEDELGYFWISSNHGIFKVLREELIAHVKGQTDVVYYHRYDESDGIRNHEFNGRCSPCAVKRSNGKFSFPSLDGIVQFDPLQMEPPQQHPLILLRRMILDNEELHPNDNMELDQGFENMEIQVQIPYAGNRNNVYAEYKLEGFNEDWQTLDNSQTIAFTRLPPGHYELQLRRKLGFGINNFSTASLPFFVRPYYYQTVWFRVLIASLLMVLIGLIFALRSFYALKRRQMLEQVIDRKTGEYKKLNEMLKLKLVQLREARTIQEQNTQTKDRFVALYTHDIRGPLRFILSIIDNSADLDDISSKEISERFEMIRSSTKGVFLRTERMFNWLQLQDRGFRIMTESVFLPDVIGEMIDQYGDQARSKALAFRNKLTLKGSINSDLNIISIIINNLVDNAIKFTDKGTITFEGYEIEGYAVLTIADTGRGISSDLVQLIQLSDKPIETSGGEKGYGLHAVKELLNRIDSYFEIESETGKGTSVSVFFKDLKKA